MIKKIVLKLLKLKNFKGIKELEINFGKATNIIGDNGTGKTTIFDSCTFLLFDKDSKDRKDFEIKTLGNDGQVIHGLDHEVTGVFEVDGKEVALQKTYREKWTKKRGEAERQLTGHETLYLINEIPVKKGEYEAYISSFVNENIFKLITNPLYFSLNMKWQERRAALLEMIGDISTERIINYNSSLARLAPYLKDSNIDTYKKSVQARKKRLNDEIKSIPFRIDELNNSIQEHDYSILENQVSSIKNEIRNVEELLLDSSMANDEVLKERDRLYKLKGKLQNLEYEAKTQVNKPLDDVNLKISKLHSEISILNNNLKNKKYMFDDKTNTIASFNKDREKLRQDWTSINQEELHISEHDLTCPTCKRAFETEDAEVKKIEMLENFNRNKAIRIQKVNENGFRIKAIAEKLEEEVIAIAKEIENIELDIANKTNSYNDLISFRDKFKAEIIETDEMKKLKEEVTALEEKLQKPIAPNGQADELKAKKRSLEVELDQVNKQLAAKESNERVKTRITELLDEEKKLAQQIAELEGQEFLCEEYIKTKVELLESGINSKFAYVTFKLFDTQVNGGLTETCEALINGVPFSNANTASQINAGLDIINALSKHYGVEAPIFIDNRESVNAILETDSQVINLMVGKNKVLNIESEEI